MAEESLLSDELLGHLMAVGQVDVLVGVPTLNNAGTIGRVVQAVHHAFARYFPRDRAVLVNSDGGSSDGTPGLVREVSTDEADRRVVADSLRTVHRISTPYSGVPGKGNALRQIFAAADLTQAKAVAVLDPDVVNVTPEWIAALIDPIRTEHCHFVAPVYPRHPLDGPLVTQIVRPLVRATYGGQVSEPLAAEFGCSGPFVAHCLEQQVWETDLAQFGIGLWVTATALAGGFNVCQARIGPRVVAAAPDRPGFPEVFQQVVGSLFHCLDTHAAYWLPRQGSTPLPTLGTATDAGGDVSAVDGRRLTQSFFADLDSLAPILESILSPRTLSRLNRIAGDDWDTLQYPDDLWVATVHEFLAAYHHGVMRRDHVTQALMPLYLGRTGSFLIRHARDDRPAGEAALERLGEHFERAKPDLVDRWNQHSSR